MKLYLFVRIDLRITQKPHWLDSFREKYDEVFPYHLSLKRAVEIDASEITSAKEKAFGIASHFKPFELNFRELFVGHTKNGYTIMIRAENNPVLRALRDQVYTSFKHYDSYYQPQHKGFDADYNPHVTIARHLSDEQLEKAKSEVQEPLNIVARIDSLQFVVTPEPHDVSYPPTVSETLSFQK